MVPDTNRIRLRPRMSLSSPGNWGDQGAFCWRLQERPQYQGYDRRMAVFRWQSTYPRVTQCLHPDLERKILTSNAVIPKLYTSLWDVCNDSSSGGFIISGAVQRANSTPCTWHHSPRKLILPTPMSQRRALPSLSTSTLDYWYIQSGSIGYDDCSEQTHPFYITMYYPKAV